MAKSKKERRSSIRHMAADDAFSVLEALERAEQGEPKAPPEAAARDDEADVDEAAEQAAEKAGSGS